MTNPTSLTPASIPSINRASPPFPCVAILFSKNAAISAFDVIQFENREQLNFARVNHVGAIRAVMIDSDLNDVPNGVLLGIFNKHQASRGGSPLERFRDRTTAEKRVYAILKEAATLYGDSTMGEAHKTASEPTNKTEAKAAAKAAKKEATAKANAEKKAAAKAAKGPGVIGTVKSMLESDTGATQDEILDALVKLFPDRTREGMSSTVKIQCSRLAKSTGIAIQNAMIVGRGAEKGQPGRVYRFQDLGPIPGEVYQPAEPTEKAEPAAKKAKPAAKKAATKK